MNKTSDNRVTYLREIKRNTNSILLKKIRGQIIADPDPGLHWEKLKNTDLSGLDLSGLDLSDADLSNTNLEKTCF